MATTVGLMLVAFAACLGWAIRGEWGNWWGETVPGALVGMSLWIAFGQSQSAWQMLAFGAAIAVSHTVGGDISYGKIVGYVVSRGSLVDRRREHPENRSPLFGLFGLFLVGGMIGFFPATALGLLMTGVAYDIGTLGLWAVLAAIGAFLTYKLVVLGLGLRLSPPRSDFWAATFGASVASMLFFGLVSRDGVVLTVSALGWLGYGSGFVVGGLLHRVAVRRRWRVDSWKWMEHSVGFFGGIGLAVSVLFLGGEIGQILLTRESRFLSAIVVFWVVPYLIVNDVFQDWTFRLWHSGTSASINLLDPNDPESRVTRRPGEVWRSITSRRVFVGFELTALCCLVLVAPIAAALAAEWKGDGLQNEVFCALIVLYTAIAVVKVVPIERSRPRVIVWATFSAMAGMCIVLVGLI